jgi:hypothetical protein
MSYLPAGRQAQNHMQNEAECCSRFSVFSLQIKVYLSSVDQFHNR